MRGGSTSKHSTASLGESTAVDEIFEGGNVDEKPALPNPKSDVHLNDEMPLKLERKDSGFVEDEACNHRATHVILNCILPTPDSTPPSGYT